jgi:hypothetical protein
MDILIFGVDVANIYSLLPKIENVCLQGSDFRDIYAYFFSPRFFLLGLFVHETFLVKIITAFFSGYFMK